MAIYNVKGSKHCAFCKYWYDPAWSAVKPVRPTIGQWAIIDDRTRRMCLKRDGERAPLEFCNEFRCKIEYGCIL